MLETVIRQQIAKDVIIFLKSVLFSEIENFQNYMLINRKK